MPKPTRREIWHHNSLLGRTGMAEAGAKAVIAANTTTDESRSLAYEILSSCRLLKTSLKTRRDQETPQ